MFLVEELQQGIQKEQSLFRAQLLREDVARLTKLVELARRVEDIDAFTKAARRLGWTQGDMRTSELGEALDALLEAVFAYETGTVGLAQETRIRDAWLELHRVRMERLVGCLSTPVPKPVE
jgi:predicted unusual protein kinase regulating ubiquinone biosynthesis (AarF/ABC1/UbiB family)